jgi:hypothetical protein
MRLESIVRVIWVSQNSLSVRKMERGEEADWQLLQPRHVRDEPYQFIRRDVAAGFDLLNADRDEACGGTGK